MQWVIGILGSFLLVLFLITSLSLDESNVFAKQYGELPTEFRGDLNIPIIENNVKCTGANMYKHKDGSCWNVPDFKSVIQFPEFTKNIKQTQLGITSVKQKAGEQTVIIQTPIKQTTITPTPIKQKNVLGGGCSMYPTSPYLWADGFCHKTPERKITNTLQKDDFFKKSSDKDPAFQKALNKAAFLKALKAIKKGPCQSERYPYYSTEDGKCHTMPVKNSDKCPWQKNFYYWKSDNKCHANNHDPKQGKYLCKDPKRPYYSQVAGGCYSSAKSAAENINLQNKLILDVKLRQNALDMKLKLGMIDISKNTCKGKFIVNADGSCTQLASCKNNPSYPYGHANGRCYKYPYCADPAFPYGGTDGQCHSKKCWKSPYTIEKNGKCYKKTTYYKSLPCPGRVCIWE